MSRKMSEFMVKTPVFMEWYNWLADMIDGDESYFSTLATLDIDKDGKIHQDMASSVTSLPALSVYRLSRITPRTGRVQWGHTAT